MSFLGVRNAVSLGVSPHVTLGGSNLLGRLSPSLILQFAGAQTLDPRITFTRSTTATFTGSDGLIQTAAIDAPRFDYNPTTLAPLGLLIEEQRVNLLLYSEEFDNAAWNKTLGTVTVTVAANSTTSPDGTVNADKVITANATGDHVIAQVASVTSGTTYTQSWFLKAAELNWVQVTESTGFGSTQFQNINLSDGTVGNGNYGSAVSVTSVGNGWYRVSVTDTATATSASGRFLVALLTSNVAARLTDVTGNGTDGVFIYGGQLEAGAFVTSYIPTVASQVTRAADVAVMTGTNFSSWYNASEGTLYGQADWMGLSNNDYFFAINNGTSSNLIAIGVSSTPLTRFIVSDGGVTQASVNGPTPVANVAFKIAGAYQANSFAAATNGVLGTVDTSGSVPTGMSAVSFTSSFGSANQFNGHIRQIVYYPRRLANSELQAITA
jgi:hypothetical protein